ncbi:MAG TPA: hypothetical protein VGC30_05425 [Dokdonella sp.]
MVENGADLPTVQKLLERVVQSPRHLVALETANVGDLLAQLRTLAMRGGPAVYLWEPDSGIASLRESGLQVPGTKRLGDALRYIAQSMHFGVYLFIGFIDALRPADTVLLRRISRLHAGSERKLVFVGGRFEPPEELDGMFERMTVNDEQRRRLRLRDGRWLT